MCRSAACRDRAAGAGWRPEAAGTDSKVSICYQIWPRYGALILHLELEYLFIAFIALINPSKPTLLSKGLSLLERLMTKNQLYMRTETGFNNNYVTKLLRNYR